MQSPNTGVGKKLCDLNRNENWHDGFEGGIEDAKNPNSSQSKRHAIHAEKDHPTQENFDYWQGWKEGFYLAD